MAAFEHCRLSEKVSEFNATSIVTKEVATEPFTLRLRSFCGRGRAIAVHMTVPSLALLLSSLYLSANKV